MECLLPQKAALPGNTVNVLMWTCVFNLPRLPYKYGVVCFLISSTSFHSRSKQF